MPDCNCGYCKSCENKKRGKARELIQAYMNCVVTRASCGGHGKAKANKMQALKLEEEIKEKLEIRPPDDAICYILGDFNGPGSC